MFGVENLMHILTIIGYPGIALIVFFESGVPFGFFLPGSSALFTAGFLASTGVFDVKTLIIVVTISAILGDSAGFLIGRYFGPALYRMKDSRFFKRAYLTSTHEFYKKHGGSTIVIARFLPIVRTFAPIIAGIVGMRYRNFLGYNIIGAIVWAGAVTWAGNYLGVRFPFLSHNLETIIIVIILLSFTPIALEYFKSRKTKTHLP